jgi:hypothetical protein
LDWTPDRFVRWGRELGPATAVVVAHILEHKPHPEQGYRSCLGLLSLAKRYTPVRLEAACARAQATGTPTYRSVKSILSAGLDTLPLERALTLTLPATHAHVRGAAYYRSAIPADSVLELALLPLTGDSSC